jgi:lipopolysaccharide/colanic/teichoic acid biosynthesis glycosyltransferase
MPIVIQRGIAAIGMVILGPLVVALAAAVRATSRGPAFHRATRVRPGGTFTLYKLRTMQANAAEAGPGITASGDRRVTRLGRLLRRTKLDELPQLWNVVRGDMALVGPRPEDPRYVDLSDPLHARIFGSLPGITGPTALEYRDEERVLEAASIEMARSHGRSEATAEDVDRAYREIVLPAKLQMDADYLASRSPSGDARIILTTVIGARARIDDATANGGRPMSTGDR